MLKDSLDEKAFTLISIFIFIGCGYKPATTYIKSDTEKKVYYELSINQSSLDQSVFVRNEIIKLIQSDMHGTIVKKRELADHILKVVFKGISLKVLSSDSKGYSSFYRVTVNLLISYDKNSFSVSGYDDYQLTSNAHTNEENKEKAIQKATKIALNKVLTHFAIESF